MATALAVASLAIVSTSPASADPGTCGTNCYLVPTPAQDPVLGVDNTGATEASLQLESYIAHIANSRADNTTPVTIRLQPDSTYWIAFSIQFRYTVTSGNGHWNTHVAPNLPSFDASNVTFDLNGSTIDQCYSPTNSDADYENCVANIWNGSGRIGGGNPVFTTEGASNVTIDGNSSAQTEADFGTITDSAMSGQTAETLARWQKAEASRLCVDPANSTTCTTFDQNWHGLTINAPSVSKFGDPADVESNIEMIRTNAEWIGGDFVYISANTNNFLADPTSAVDVQDVTVAFNKLYHSVRQGITVLGGEHLTFAVNDISDANRYAFDSEPSAGQGWNDVNIASNLVSGLGLGFVNYQGVHAHATGLTIDSNVIWTSSGNGGNASITVNHSLTTGGQLDGNTVKITNNRQDQAGTAFPPLSIPVTACWGSKSQFLINVGAFDGVTVTGNVNYVKNYPHLNNPVHDVSVSANAANVTVDHSGFHDPSYENNPPGSTICS